MELICPLCGAAVPLTAAACRGCHLPIADVRGNQPPRRLRGRSLARSAVVRLAGLVLYAVVVAWCATQLPTSLPFVAPAAVLGAAVHVLKGRPWMGVAVFVVVVAALPFLLLPALGTGAFADLTDWF